MKENLLASLKVCNKHEISEQQLNPMFVARDVKCRQARIQNDKRLIQTKGVTDSKFFFKRKTHFLAPAGKTPTSRCQRRGLWWWGCQGGVIAIFHQKRESKLEKVVRGWLVNPSTFFLSRSFYVIHSNPNTHTHTPMCTLTHTHTHNQNTTIHIASLHTLPH